MKFVVDTNIIIPFFWKKSITQILFSLQEFDLYAPEYTLKEIKEHKAEIIEKANISDEEFNKKIQQLTALITFIPIEKYAPLINHATKITPDKDDCDFVALALELQCSLWSNDRLLKTIRGLKVVTTKEIIELFD